MTNPTPREQAIRHQAEQLLRALALKAKSLDAAPTVPDVPPLLRSAACAIGALVALLDQLRAEGQSSQLADAAEMLWVVLANVSGGDWTKQTAEWQEAAARWRDNYFAAIRAEPDLGIQGVALLEWARQIRAADDQQTLLAIADDIEVNGKAALGDPLRAEGQPPQDGAVLGVTVAGGWETTVRARGTEATEALVASLRQQLEDKRFYYQSALAGHVELQNDYDRVRQQLAQAQQERQLLAERVQDIPDIQARAEAAEATVATLQQLLEDEITEDARYLLRYQLADPSGNRARDRLWENIKAALAALPTPPQTPPT